MNVKTNSRYCRACKESSVQAVEIFAQKLEIRRLSKILTENDIAPLSHPYEALLSYHILVTNSEQDLWEKFVEIDGKHQLPFTVQILQPIFPQWHKV